MMQCSCCLRNIENEKCSYCGLINILTFGEEAALKNKQYVEAHKKGLIDKLTDFKFDCRTYTWNDITEKLDMKLSKVKLADGKDCFNTIKWSRDSFGHNSCMNESLKISYKFDGEEKQLSVKLIPVDSNGYWKLGIMLKEDLSLNVYLGTVGDRQYNTFGPYSLKLE